MEPLFSTTQLSSSADQDLNGANRKSETDAPDGPTLLNRFARYCKKMAASAVTKNLAGLMIGAGSGATFGCPWVIGLLVGAGVGTSWIGGLGIALIGVGIVLWAISTVLSANRDDACDSLPLEIGFSAFMGVVGIAYVIAGAIGNCFNSCCCGVPPDEDAYLPVQKKMIAVEDIVEYTSKMSLEERKLFAERFLGLGGLTHQTPPVSTMLQPPRLLSQAQRHNAFAGSTVSASSSSTSISRELPETPTASNVSEINQHQTNAIFIP